MPVQETSTKHLRKPSPPRDSDSSFPPIKTPSPALIKTFHLHYLGSISPTPSSSSINPREAEAKADLSKSETSGSCHHLELGPLEFHHLPAIRHPSSFHQNQERRGLNSLSNTPLHQARVSNRRLTSGTSGLLVPTLTSLQDTLPFPPTKQISNSIPNTFSATHSTARHLAPAKVLVPASSLNLFPSFLQPILQTLPLPQLSLVSIKVRVAITPKLQNLPLHHAISRSPLPIAIYQVLVPDSRSPKTKQIHCLTAGAACPFLHFCVVPGPTHSHSHSHLQLQHLNVWSSSPNPHNPLLLTLKSLILVRNET